jgi:hypothetical protein
MLENSSSISSQITGRMNQVCNTLTVNLSPCLPLSTKVERGTKGVRFQIIRKPYNSVTLYYAIRFRQERCIEKSTTGFLIHWKFDPTPSETGLTRATNGLYCK